MQTILDTSDINEIKRWSNILNKQITHITTNPHLLKEAGIDSDEKMKEFVLELSERILSPHIFFQCFTVEDLQKIVDMKNSIQSKTRVEYIAKITMHPKYFHLIKKAQMRDLSVAATTCYDLAQVHLAAELGMDYSMVYFAKNDDETLLSDAVKMKNDYGYNITLVAASFRTKKDFTTAIKSGIDAATVPPKVLDLVYQNENTVRDVLKIYNMPDPLSVIKE